MAPFACAAVPVPIAIEFAFAVVPAAPIAIAYCPLAVAKESPMTIASYPTGTGAAPVMVVAKYGLPAGGRVIATSLAPITLPVLSTTNCPTCVASPYVPAITPLLK